jgi:nicotinamidase-related amidase
MATIASPANFDGQKPVIDPNDAVMLLIDHQSGLFQTIGDMPMPTLRSHAAALAKMAALSKMPVITTASVPQGPNGPPIPEIYENAPHAKYVARKGEISAWDHPEFVAAVKATGRKTLIIAGTITSVCMAFPALRRCTKATESSPWSMLRAPTRKWRRRSRSRASCRPESYPSTPQP